MMDYRLAFGFLLLTVIHAAVASPQYQPAPALYPDDTVDGPSVDSTVTVRANPNFRTDRFNRWLYGDNYRTEWDTPVTLPVFDIGTEHGGLYIVQKGGGGQTLSLRLEADDEHQYVLRSVRKFPERNIPDNIRSPFVEKIVTNQTSASHPYGALVVPSLAEAVGVYHTNPQIVYVPDDPRLGEHRRTHGHSLALYEERPDEDWSQQRSFGYSAEIYGTKKMLEKLQEDQDNEVDQRAFLKARLLDLPIGDWDRHEDQWRWASFEKGKGELFVPIPRDRDQVFYDSEGLLPTIVSWEFLLPMFQGFREEVRNVNSLFMNAKDIDHRLLNDLERDDWIEVAQRMQHRLPDVLIEQAVHRMPATVVDLSGEEITRKLKARRDDLVRYAEDYYTFLAKTVVVTGTDKKELFQVKHLDDQRTRVTVFKLSKKQEQVEQIIFQRTFLTGETREVRLYGLRDDDDFRVTGDVSRSITLRVIGGEGEDRITDSSQVRGLRRKTQVYDSREGNELYLGREVRNRTSSPERIPDYHYRWFQYNYLSPLVSLAYNRDDGLFLGGGFVYRTQGFGKVPFATEHRLLARYALATSAYDFRYEGTFTDAVGPLDLLVNLEVREPNYVSNFFGIGNETSYNSDERDIAYYRYRFGEQRASVQLRHQFTPHSVLSAGPMYHRIAIEDTDGRFITNFNENGLDEETTFLTNRYWGATARYELNRLNTFQPTTQQGDVALANMVGSFSNNRLVQRGLFWEVSGSWLAGNTDHTTGVARLRSELQLFHSVNIPSRLTFALRVGGEHVFQDDYPFFQAATLGSLSNLRGYRRTRFHGQTSLYNNLEARLSLGQFGTYLAPISYGLIAFNDVGRVWTDGADSDGDPSDTWHHGYGAGVYLAPFDMVVLSAYWSFSEEENLPLVQIGFFF